MRNDNLICETTLLIQTFIWNFHFLLKNFMSQKSIIIIGDSTLLKPFQRQPLHFIKLLQPFNSIPSLDLKTILNNSNHW